MVDYNKKAPFRLEDFNLSALDKIKTHKVRDNIKLTFNLESSKTLKSTYQLIVLANKQLLIMKVTLYQNHSPRIIFSHYKEMWRILSNLNLDFPKLSWNKAVNNGIVAQHAIQNAQSELYAQSNK